MIPLKNAEDPTTEKAGHWLATINLAPGYQKRGIPNERCTAGSPTTTNPQLRWCRISLNSMHMPFM